MGLTQASAEQLETGGYVWNVMPLPNTVMSFMPPDLLVEKL